MKEQISGERASCPFQFLSYKNAIFFWKSIMESIWYVQLCVILYCSRCRLRNAYIYIIYSNSFFSRPSRNLGELFWLERPAFERVCSECFMACIGRHVLFSFSSRRFCLAKDIYILCQYVGIQEFIDGSWAKVSFSRRHRAKNIKLDTFILKRAWDLSFAWIAHSLLFNMCF